METRYHICEFGSLRRDPLYGAQARGPQESGGADTHRDFGGDFRGGRVLQASLDVNKEVQHEFNGLVDSITLVRILNAIGNNRCTMEEFVLIRFMSLSRRILSYLTMLAFQAGDV
jgi:hypothetical protein